MHILIAETINEFTFWDILSPFQILEWVSIAEATVGDIIARVKSSNLDYVLKI